jgi:autotransporter-associated beta strand protein
MQITTTSASRALPRRNPRYAVLAMLAAVAAASPASVALADNFVWTGESFETNEYGSNETFTGLIDAGLYSGYSPWDNIDNWSQNGGAALRLPNATDTVTFGSGFASGVPRSFSNRTVNELRFAGNNQPGLHFMVLASLGLGRQRTTLNIDSGRLYVNAGNSFHIEADVRNNAAADWDVRTNFVLDGFLAAPSLTIRGGGKVSHEAALITPTLTVESGAYVYAFSDPGETDPGISLNSLTVGDADSSTTAATFAANETRVSAQTLNARYDAFVGFGGNGDYNIGVANLTGGAIRAEQTSSNSNPILKVGAVIASPGHNGSGFVRSRMIGIAGFTNTTPTATLRFPDAGGVIETSTLTVNGVTSDDALAIDLSVVTPKLTFRGNGRTTFVDPEFPFHPNLNNNIVETVVESGELWLSRQKELDGNTIGGTVTIGKAGTSVPARIHVTQSEQIADPAILTILGNGRLTLASGVTETVGGIILNGGAVDTGAGTLVNGGNTVVGGFSSIAGNYNLKNREHTIADTAGNTLLLSATLSNGSLRVESAGSVLMSGAGDNALSASTVVNGLLSLGKAAGADALAGPVAIGLATGTGNPTVQWTANDQVNDASAVTLRRGTMDLNGRTDTIGGLTLLGGTFLAGSGELGLAGNLSADVNGTTQTLTNVNLVGAARTFDVAAGTTVAVSGAVRGQRLNKAGAGTLRLAGSSANTQAGTTAAAGTLLLAKTAGQSAVGGSLTIGDGTSTGTPVVRYLASNQVPDTADLNFEGAGTVELNGFSDTVDTFITFGGTANVTTGAGTLTLAGSKSFLLAPLTFNGNLSLNGATHEFDVSNAVTLTGTLNNGRLKKNLNGTLSLQGVTGNAVLELNGANNTALGSSGFGGLAGSGGLFVASGRSVSIDLPAAADLTYTGALSGPGEFVKRGAGTQRLAGASANTIAGLVNVENGALYLSKTTGPAAAGNVTVGPAGLLYTTQDNQFGASTALTVSGGVFLNGRSHTLASVAATNGYVANGALDTAGAVSLNGSIMENVRLDVAAGGISAASAWFNRIGGTVAGNSSIDAGSNLTVARTLAGATELQFANGLNLANGATVSLIPTTPGGAAIIDVNGPLLVGATTTSPGIPFPLLTGMNGVATIDLSGAGLLLPGVYPLIDFSATPVTVLFNTGSVFAKVTNFSLIPPSTPGSLSVQNNVLVFTAVPEPTSVAALLSPLALLARRRRRW